MNLVWYKKRIRDRIKLFLQTHKRLACFVHLIRYGRNEDYIKSILKINNDPNVIELREYGEANPYKNIFFIELGGETGIGGMLRSTLHALYEAERLGFIPVVSYTNQYIAADSSIHGTENPFEYYFQPVSDISVAQVFESKRVFLFRPIHLERIERDLGNLNPELVVGYHITKDYLIILASVMQKYIRFNKNTEHYFTESMECLFQKNSTLDRVLAVHIRGTDFALHWDNHPNMLVPEDYFSEIDILLKRDFDYIFLATDDNRRLESFVERYGNRVLYYEDTYRSSKNINIVHEKNAREHGPYLNGLEALRDVYTLSRCGGFISGISQISIITRILRLSRGCDFSYVRTLDRGIYRTNESGT